MKIFLTCLLNGLFKEYRWLNNEFNNNWSNRKKHTELSPKEIKIIINRALSAIVTPEYTLNEFT